LSQNYQYFQNATDTADSLTQDEETKSVLMEFGISVLPCYVFILLAFYRFYQIRHHGHSSDQPDLYALKVIQYIAYGMCGIYGFNWLVGYLAPSKVNFDAKGMEYAILYIVPMVAWYLSYELTSEELKRKLLPDQLNQFLFWILSVVFSIVKFLAEPKRIKLVTLIDIGEIVLSIAMVVYYHDKERFIIDFVEEDEEKAQFTQGLLNTFRDKTFSLRFNNDFDDNNDDDMERSKEKLVKIETKIPQKFQRRMISPGVFDKYFDIKVSINNEPKHKVSHSLVEFIDLAKKLHVIYTISKFKVLSIDPPSLDFEYLQRLNNSEDMEDLNAMIEALEKFLSEIYKDPLFMHDIVLDFLNIQEPYRKDFTKYINYSQMMSSKISSIEKDRKKSLNDSVELKEIHAQPVQKRLKEVVKNARIQDLRLEVKKVRFVYFMQKNDVFYNYEISMTKNPHDPQVSWVISKSFTDFKAFYQKMREELSFHILELKEFVPSKFGLGLESDAEEEMYRVKMLDGLEKYLKTIISIKKMYCATLFEFLGINPITFEVRKKENFGDNT